MYISAHPPIRGHQADVSDQRGVLEGSPNMEAPGRQLISVW